MKKLERPQKLLLLQSNGTKRNRQSVSLKDTGEELFDVRHVFSCNLSA